MRRQEGVTLSGFIVVAVIGIVILLAVFKIGPAYWEFMTIQKQLKAVAADPAAATGDRRAIEGLFVSRATIENIQSINHSDLQINKEGNTVVISAEYQVKVPLFHNLSACMDFNASSRK
jgi:ABC-type glycerol-3-phosphate transport system permease component